MPDEDASRNNVEGLGKILNAHVIVLGAANIIVQRTEHDYRFSQPGGSCEIKDLTAGKRHIYSIFRRIRAAYLLGRVYRNTQEECERKMAQEELKQCRLGRFFMYARRITLNTP